MWAITGATTAISTSGSNLITNWTSAQANYWNTLNAEVFTTGGQTMSFKHTKIKTASKPTFGIGFTPTGYLATYDVANDKILLRNGTTEFASGGDLTGVTARMTFFFPKV